MVEMASAEKAATKSIEAAALKAATEKVASEKKAIVMKSDFVASTNCIGNTLSEWKSCSIVGKKWDPGSKSFFGPN